MTGPPPPSSSCSLPRGRFIKGNVVSKRKGEALNPKPLKFSKASKGGDASQPRRLISAHEALEFERSRPGFTVFHTELWMQKQERAFTAWLNAIFWQTDINQGGGEGEGEGEGSSTRTTTTLTESRLDAQVRGSLWRIYTKDARFKSAMLGVEKAIDAGKIVMRHAGASLISDIKLQRSALDAIQSYNPFWLQQGLEAVLGAQMPQEEAYTDAGLRKIMVDRLLGDPVLARKYARNATVDGIYKTGYEEARAKAFLKKFLVMVMLIDRLATELEEKEKSMPLVFKRKACVKSSKALIATVLKESMFGEGDVIRHLGFHKYAVAYEQAAITEYDFKITNLAVDLRDGVRLCKLSDHITHRGGCDRSDKACLSSKIKVATALSSATQESNTKKALAALERVGVSLNGVVCRYGMLDIAAKDIVRGDRELTLQLLWRVMRDWQIPSTIKLSSLELEIKRVQGSQGIEEKGDAAFCTDPALAAHAGNKHIALLLRWAQAICALKGKRIHNLTSCFADGYAWCLLLNHYLPHLAPTQEMHDTNISYDAMLRGEEEGEGGGEDEESECKGMPLEMHGDGVGMNFAIVQRCVQKLGNLPHMVSKSDFYSHGPDERVVISFLSVLCSRLMEISCEERAALLIQSVWRHGVQRKVQPLQVLQSWINSAAIIQKAWRAHTLKSTRKAEIDRRNAAALLIQSKFCDFKTCKAAKDVVDRRLRGITKTQAHIRMFLGRRRFMSTKRSAITVQKHVRAWSARRLFADQFVIPKLLVAAQQKRTALASKRQQAKLQRCACRIQSNFRMHKARKSYEKTKRSITLCQAHIRKVLAVKRYDKVKASVTLMQACWRRQAARKLLSQHKSARVLQKAFKGYVVRKHYKHAHQSATAIQTAFRMHRQVVSFRQDMQRVVKSQSIVRAWLATRSLRAHQNAVVCIQKNWRRQAARKLLSQHKSARVLQKAFKGYVVRKHYKHAHQSATAIQTAFRMHRQVVSFRQDMQRVVKSQSIVRAWLATRSLRAHQNAVVCIQKNWRSFRCASASKKEEAAVLIQTMFRGYAAKTRFMATKKSACIIQASYRGWCCRKKYLRMIKMKRAMEEFAKAARIFALKSTAALRIQKLWRGAKARKMVHRVLAKERHALRIQAHWKGFVQRKAYLGTLDALNTLKRCLPLLRDRCHYLQMRRACITVQAAWRSRYAEKVRAAKMIQRAARAWAKRHEATQHERRVVLVQSAWRAFRVRRDSSAAVQSLRQRLNAANGRVQTNPSLSIGNKTQRAIEALERNRSASAMFSVCKTLKATTAHSKSCCRMLAGSDAAMAALLRFMRACHRTSSDSQILLMMFEIFGHVIRHVDLMDRVVTTPDVLTVFSEVLQTFRGDQVVFLPAASILKTLCWHCHGDSMRISEHGMEKEKGRERERELGNVRRRIEGIHQILRQKLMLEKKYIHRMEYKKGSDVAAHSSAIKVVSITAEVNALEAILSAFSDGTKQAQGEGGTQGASDLALPAFRNTIVRRACHESQKAK